MTTSFKRIPSLAVATAISLFALSANAIEPEVRAGMSRTVKMWDLDLAKSEDVQILYDRLRTAATDVCRKEAHRHWTRTRQAVPLGWTDRCITGAVEAAVRDVGNSGLATLHTSGIQARL